jgi:hypothetical protein
MIRRLPRPRGAIIGRSKSFVSGRPGRLSFFHHRVRLCGIRPTWRGGERPFQGRANDGGHLTQAFRPGLVEPALQAGGVSRRISSFG